MGAGAIVIPFPAERARRSRTRAGQELAAWALPLFERVSRHERRFFGGLLALMIGVALL